MAIFIFGWTMPLNYLEIVIIQTKIVIILSCPKQRLGERNDFFF